jgi:alpha-beta hydrolase superfamily lysophospholipase
MRITKQVEELNVAFQQLMKEKRIDKERIGIFAHSLGTLVACLFQTKYQKAKTLILAAPALNQERLIKKWYKKSEIEKWKKQKYLDMEKFRIGFGYLKEAIDYTKILSQIKIPTLILHGRKDEDIPEKIAKEAFSKIGTREKEMKIIKETDHHFENYLGRRKLIVLSIKWFKKYL